MSPSKLYRGCRQFRVATQNRRQVRRARRDCRGTVVYNPQTPGTQGVPRHPRVKVVHPRWAYTATPGSRSAWLTQDHDFYARLRPGVVLHVVPGGSPRYGPSLVRGRVLNFGHHGVLSLAYGQLRSSCVAALVTMARRHVARGTSVMARLACDVAITARPTESRMGKGKGLLVGWAAKAQPGQVLFEFCGRRPPAAGLLRALRRASSLRLTEAR